MTAAIPAATSRATGEARDRPSRERPTTRGLYLDHGSVVHRLPPEVKIVAMVGYTVAVVVTPREAFWAFGAYLLPILAGAGLARVRLRWLLLRSVIELPFVLLAVSLPLVAGGPRVTWLGLSLSVDGLYGAWNILAKGTLGVYASLLLAATTRVDEIILGLDRLRFPPVLTQIATFMMRYLEVLAGEARRLRIARISRSDDPRFLWQLRGFAAGIGTLFLRSYERGERVYLAMISRGYAGRLPAAWRGEGAATPGQWSAAAAVAVPMAVMATVAVWITP